MTTTALSEALAKLRQLKVPNWPAGRILGDIADEIESALASAEPVATVCLRGEPYAHGNMIEVQLQIVPGAELPIGTKLYARAKPAAKVEVQPSEIVKVMPSIRCSHLGCIAKANGGEVCDPFRCKLSHGDAAAARRASAIFDKLEKMPKPAPTPASVPDGFRAFPDHVPDPDTQCVVLTAFAGQLCPSVDTWEMQREAPLSFSSASIETGFDWSDMGADVLYWKPVGELPAYPTTTEPTP